MKSKKIKIKSLKMKSLKNNIKSKLVKTSKNNKMLLRGGDKNKKKSKKSVQNIFATFPVRGLTKQGNIVINPIAYNINNKYRSNEYGFENENFENFGSFSHSHYNNKLIGEKANSPQSFKV